MARRRATRRQASTIQKAKDFTRVIREDFEEEIEAQLNGFVRAVVSDLTSDGTKNGVSPVLTGFFASSWKAGNTRPSRESSIPAAWKKIKYTHTKKPKLLPGHKPLIKQRHPVPNDITIKKPVFIGNTAKYAPYALTSRKSQVFPYLAGGSGKFKEGLGDKINKFFTDKRSDIRVGGDVDAAGRISYQKS